MNYTIQDLANLSNEKIRQLDSIAHNLANAATPGFKAQYLHIRAAEPSRFADVLQNIDHSQGALEQTGNALDVALQGEGFFAVQTKNGPAYTRKGSFLLNAKQELVTDEGMPVLGEGGRITARGTDVRIDGTGTVVVDGAAGEKLKVVRFADPANLKKQGDALFVNVGGAPPRKAEDVKFAPGHLERSNARVVEHMVAMIEIQRTFETYAKLIQNLSDLDRLSTNRVGKLV